MATKEAQQQSRLSLRARIRLLLRPPRRLRMRRAGTVLILGIFGLGFATLNTGNNVLYLLLGALLGLIALSGWLSERCLQRNRITRILPASVTAGHSARIEYRVQNAKSIMPTVALELTDAGVPRAHFGSAFVALIEPGRYASATAEARFDRRGVYSLHTLIASTSYPFGLFAKERDLIVPAAITVWPRTDRPVRSPLPAGRRGIRRAAGAGAAVGAERGDFRSLRPYRPGDDPRDVHWRTTARRGEPIMREYDRDAAEAYWIVLDTVAGNEVVFEIAVELAAALIERAVDAGERVGCQIGAVRIPPRGDRTAIEAALDALAHVERADNGAPSLPAPASECVMVTARDLPPDPYADMFRATAETTLPA